METTNEQLMLVPTAAEQLVELTLATCASKATRRIYRIQITKFLVSGLPLNREGVALHIQRLRDSGTSSSTVLGSLSAIKKLAREAMIRNLMSHDDYHQIDEIHGGKHTKQRTGMWLTIDQVRLLLAAPNRDTYRGRRDACILSIMIGCALRREEMTNIKWAQYQSRDGRMCLVDLTGKGNKKRTVPVPLWAQADVDRWQMTSQGPAPVAETPVEKAMEARRHVDNSYITGGLGYEGLYDLVQMYGERIGVKIAPHDLRRTLAQMLRRSGASLEQIQHTLGHESISTTMIYLGSTLELAPGAAAVDKLALHRPTSIDRGVTK